MQYSISIVIPTYHRKKSLMALLKNLAKTVKFAGDVVVVEQCDNNEAEIRSVAKKLGLRLTYIYLEQASMAHSTNVGVQQAKTDLVLILDDDVLGSTGFVQHHADNFSDPGIAATVGRCVTEGQTLQPDFTRTGRINWFGTVSDGFSSTIRQEVDTVIGCNMCWRRSVYMELNGMDEKFTGNALRLDSDLSLRAKKNGYKIVFDPTAEIQHMRDPNGGARKTEGRIQWYFHFFSNETYFFLKHFSPLLLPLFLLTKWQWAIRCIFGFGREVSMRSLATPISGIISGLQKYYNKGYDNRR